MFKSIALSLAFWLLTSLLLACAPAYKYSCVTDRECEEEEAMMQYAYELDLDRDELEEVNPEFIKVFEEADACSSR